MHVASNICYEAQGGKYGEFRINRQCSLVGIRLRHLSGRFSTSPTVHRRWGNSNGWKFLTVIANSTGGLLFPDTINTAGSYLLDGFRTNDPLIYFNRLQPMSVRKDDVMRVWWGRDFMNANNIWYGTHCVDIDVACII